MPLSAARGGVGLRMAQHICSLIAHHLRQDGLSGQSPSFVGEAHHESLDRWGPHGMLADEARAQGWLPAPGAGTDPLADPAFRSLHQAGVRFYDPTRRLDASRFSTPGGYP